MCLTAEHRRTIVTGSMYARRSCIWLRRSPGIARTLVGDMLTFHH